MRILLALFLLAQEPKACFEPIMRVVPDGIAVSGGTGKGVTLERTDTSKPRICFMSYGTYTVELRHGKTVERFLIKIYRSEKENEKPEIKVSPLVIDPVI